MNKKTAIQVLIVFLIVIISLWLYFKYFNNSPKILKETSIIEKLETNKNSSSTYIDNINYISSDLNNNTYQITAKRAEIKIENPNIMFLENVISEIFVKNSDIVKITSDLGKYNSKNYDTIFSKNVIIVYAGHEIRGEYLDFSFLNSLMTISKNVVYTGEKTNLFADKIEINLTTKDTKIFMNDDDKQVLIKGAK